MNSFTRFLRWFRALGSLVILATAGFAQNFDQQPVGVPVSIWGTASASPRAGEPGTLEIYGATLPSATWSSGYFSCFGSRSTNGSFSSSTAKVFLEPGKVYYISMYGDYASGMALYAVPVAGYKLEIEGLPRNYYSVLAFGFHISADVKVRLVPQMEAYAGRAGKLRKSQTIVCIGRFRWES